MFAVRSCKLTFAHFLRFLRRVIGFGILRSWMHILESSISRSCKLLGCNASFPNYCEDMNGGSCSGRKLFVTFVTRTRCVLGFKRDRLCRDQEERKMIQVELGKQCQQIIMNEATAIKESNKRRRFWYFLTVKWDLVPLFPRFNRSRLSAFRPREHQSQQRVKKKHTCHPR